MKKWLVLLMAAVMMLCMVTASFAATVSDQIVDAGTTWYYDANGNRVRNATFPGNAVVELSKTVEPTGVENEFLVELKVRTTQSILEL